MTTKCEHDWEQTDKSSLSIETVKCKKCFCWKSVYEMEKQTATKILEMIKREIKNLHDASQSMPKQAAYLIALKLIKNKIRKEFDL